MRQRASIAFSILVTLSFAATTVHAGSDWPFVPADFQVPATLEKPTYRLRMLTVNDVVKDYDAVMSSATHIQDVGPPGMTWPTGLTFEEDLIDLGWHQKEFINRTSFAYTVVTPDESRVLGCVYINPTRKEGADAAVSLWTRPPEQLEFLDEARLRADVRAWLKKDWPFENPVFPGKDISWADWSSLPEHPR
ncbi:MAG: GNAT family N-acetyltransferase [Pseudomonadota bacterium]